jgi:hypothetical protein
MSPMTFDEWRATDGGRFEPASLEKGYRTYVDAVIFIRSQIGGMPSGDAADSRTWQPPLFSAER